ncbi:unnamed protein product [Camellia sinensis]
MNDMEFFEALAYLVLEVVDNATTPMDRVPIANVGLVDDGTQGFSLLARIEPFEDFKDVTDAEEAVHVLEHLGLVGREVGCEWAFRGALPHLVFARGTS